MKISKRLKTIASLVPDNTYVVDVGCDHGLLDIYLSLNNHYCIASDISKKCIEKVKENIKKYQVQDKVIPICTDGITNIEIPDNTCLILSGLGTKTIIDIINKCPLDNINSIIIQSNNELDILRFKMMKNFHLEDEISIYDKNIFYVVMKWKKGSITYNDKELYLGSILPIKKESKKYYQFLLEKNQNILNKIPSNHLEKKQLLEKQIKWLEETLKD